MLVDFYILRDATFNADLILGREFLSKEKLTLVFKSVADHETDRVSLFNALSLYVQDETVENFELNIDFDVNVRDCVKDTITRV